LLSRQSAALFAAAAAAAADDDDDDDGADDVAGGASFFACQRRRPSSLIRYGSRTAPHRLTDRPNGRSTILSSQRRDGPKRLRTVNTVHRQGGPGFRADAWHIAKSGQTGLLCSSLQHRVQQLLLSVADWVSVFTACGGKSFFSSDRPSTLAADISTS